MQTVDLQTYVHGRSWSWSGDPVPRSPYAAIQVRLLLLDRIARTTYVDVVYCYQPSVVQWSVGLSVCHTGEPCENSRTDRVAIWVVGSDGPKESC